MKPVLVGAIALLASMGLSVGTASATTLYQCSVNKRPGEWIPQAFVFGLDEGSQSAIVADDVTLALTGGPVTARVKQNGSRVTLDWKIKNVKDRRNVRADLRYTASFRLNSGAVSMAATPVGYTARFNGKGQCKVVSAAQTQQLASLMGNSRIKKAAARVAAVENTYDCTITRKRNHDAATPDALTITLKDNKITVQDTLMQELGQKPRTTAINRVVGQELIFGWNLKKVPADLLPAGLKAARHHAVNYSARLNTKTGKFTMRGDLATSVGFAEASNMVGSGRCKLRKS